jgi:hypothetical protein
MPIVGGLDIHRKQITFDYLDTATGEVKRGQIVPADRAHLRSWLVRFAGRNDVAFALEGCTGWRYIAEELAGGIRYSRGSSPQAAVVAAVGAAQANNGECGRRRRGRAPARLIACEPSTCSAPQPDR